LAGLQTLAERVTGILPESREDCLSSFPEAATICEGLPVFASFVLGE